MRSLTSGWLIALEMPSESLTTMFLGVVAGANMPYHTSLPNPGMPASATVGRCGTPSDRLLAVTARARSLPTLT
jgi:hypothetical protein